MDEYVTDFEIHNDVLYAGTQSDLFRFKLDEPDSWQALGLAELIDGRGIRGFINLDTSTILVGVSSFGEYRHDTTPIYRTTDGGESWHPFQNGLGREEGDFNALWGLDIDPLNNIIFAAAGGAIARSHNGGQSWERVHGSWATAPWPGFLQVDQQNPEIVWRGSASAMFEPWIVKTEDGGETWDRFQPFEGGEGLPTDILIHPENSDHVLLAGINTFTTDGGDTWDTYSPGRVGLYAITGSARHLETAFASGVNQEGTLFFARTTDFGESWEIVDHEEGPRDIKVEEMEATVHEGQEILFLGTNKGVYSYTFEE